MSDWLTLASDAFKTSTGFIDSNYRKRWEDNISYFSNRHPKDSKYHGETYKYRSKIFRPKIRSVIRKNEAAAAAAFFSNVDVVTCEPANDNDPLQKASAEVYQQLLNYRLQKTIPWFITLIGAFQETQVIGVVCSYQYWKYKDKTVADILAEGFPVSAIIGVFALTLAAVGGAALGAFAALREASGERVSAFSYDLSSFDRWERIAEIDSGEKCRWRESSPSA